MICLTTIVSDVKIDIALKAGYMKYDLNQILIITIFLGIFVFACNKINKPPNVPTIPIGPLNGFVDSLYTFSSLAKDSDGNDISIRFDWGDGDTSDWSSWTKSGDSISMSHAWSSPDSYYIKAQARDIKGEISDWSPGRVIFITEAPLFKWRFYLGEYCCSSPAISSDGTIYAGGNGLYAINPDGSLKWMYPTEYSEYNAPSVDSDGTIYIVSTEHWGIGSLYSINPDGTLKWRYKIDPICNSITYSPALGANGTIYFGANDDYFYALNPDSTLKWRCLLDQSVISSPTISSDGTIYITTGHYLYAFNHDSTIKWIYQANDRISCSPSIGFDGTLYFGSDSSLYALFPDGTEKWHYNVGSNILSPPSSDINGSIYFGTYDKNVCALTANGELKWLFPTTGAITSSSAIGSDGTIYIGSRDKCIYAISPNGKLKWRYLTGDYVEASPSISPDGTIYIGSYDGYLYAIQGSSPLANSAWPMYQHDLKHTGRAGGGTIKYK